MSFTNVNIPVRNQYGFWNTDRNQGQSFIVENTSPVISAVQGDFDDVPNMAAITTGAYLKSIDLLITNFESSDTDLKVVMYEGIPPANSSGLPAKYAETEVVTIPGSTGYTHYTFNFVDKANTQFYTSGSQYYFMIYLPTEAQPTTENLGIGANADSVYANGDKLSIAYATGAIQPSGSYDINMRLNYSQTSGFAADPKIFTLDNSFYHLPVDDNCYCIYDSMDPSDRLVINMKCHIRKTGKSYGRFVYVYYNGEEIVVRLPNLMIGIVSDKLNQQVEEDNVPRNNNQRYKSDAIMEIGRTSTTRKLKVTTNKYGSFHLSFNKNKFGFNLSGALDKLNTNKSIGCVKGTKMRIPNITFKALL